MISTETKKAKKFTSNLGKQLDSEGWFQVIVNGGVIARFETKEQALNYAKPLLKLKNPSLITEVKQA